MKIWLLAMVAWGCVTAQPALEVERAKHAERARIRAHLTRVEADLRARDVSALTAERRAARTRHLDRLREYRTRGVFPHNHDRAARTPCFVDRHGTPCAMAHLIAESGGVALVERVRRDANLARIRELERDPELVAWLDGAGLTAAEAARVQPGYDGHGGDGADDDVFWTTTLVTFAMLEAAGTLAGLAPAEPGSSARAFGKGVGFFGMWFGTLLVMHKGPEADREGAMIVAGGLVSFAASSRDVRRPSPPATDPDEGSARREDTPPRPTLATGVRFDDAGHPQLAVRVGF